MAEMIDRAIHEAVQEEGQPDSLATRLAAWFNAVSDGNESLEDAEAVKRRVLLLLRECKVSEEE